MTLSFNSDVIIAADVNLGALEEHLEHPLDSYLSLRGNRLVCVRDQTTEKVEEVLATNQIVAKCLASEQEQVSRVLLRTFTSPEITPENCLGKQKRSYITKRDLEVKHRLNRNVELNDGCKKTNESVRELQRYITNPRKHPEGFAHAKKALNSINLNEKEQQEQGGFDALVDRPIAKQSTPSKTPSVEALMLPSLKVDAEKVDRFVTKELKGEIAAQNSRLKKALQFVDYAHFKTPTVLPVVTKRVALEMLSGGVDPFTKKRVVETLGKGLFGIVSRVDVSGEALAEKVFLAQAVNKVPLGISTNKDYEILAELDHPNIVKIMHIENDNKGEHVYMEYVDGCSLENFESKNLTASEILRLIIQIGEGLAYLHSMHCCHNDFYARNIIIARDHSTAKIIDFGNAKKLPESSVASDYAVDVGGFLSAISYLLDSSDEDSKEKKEVIRLIGAYLEQVYNVRRTISMNEVLAGLKAIKLSQEVL